ncbi:MAG: hypothetical protein ACRD36_02360, partial [Candidatus Acidiferrum sp.]
AKAKGPGKDNKEPRGQGKDDTKDPKGEAKKPVKKDAKPGDSKATKDKKPGDGAAAKASESKEKKPGEAKDNKPSDAKPGDKNSKSGPNRDSKPKGRGDGKAEPKDGPKSDGKPMDSQSKPSGKGGQQSQSKPGEQGKSGDPPRADDQKPQENPAKKQIEDALKSQKNAEKDLNKKKNKDAVANQDDAITKLKKAQKTLEDLLKQLREEEIERLLAALQGRCERMLAMQIAVRDGTVALDKSIDKKDPTREQQQLSNELSDKEDEIVREASKAIRIIQEEGSAVAFAEVFIQVRGDMTIVAGRLRKTDTTVVTQTIENDIIATLQEMIEALKKARKDNQNKQQQQPQQGGGSPQDQRLIDMIAELKMIRSMQLRVNSRTAVYGKQYEGEQAPLATAAPDAKLREKYEMIQRELRILAERQLKIEKVTSDIAKGKNKAN